MMDDIETPLKDDKLTLNSDDVMLLYNDGITEAWVKGSEKDNRNVSTDMFGDKLLAEILLENGHLSTDEIRDALLLKLDDYMTTDDVTMVVLKRN